MQVENNNRYVRKFLLYDNLKSELNKRLQNNKFKLSQEILKELGLKLCNAEARHIKHILAIIIHYYFSINKNNPFVKINGRMNKKLPYEIRTNNEGKGISFEIHKLPPIVQGLLCIYCDL